MQTKTQNFWAGLRDGLPICLGYFAVSFAFGIQAAGIGFPYRRPPRFPPQT